MHVVLFLCNLKMKNYLCTRWLMCTQWNGLRRLLIRESSTGKMRIKENTPIWYQGFDAPILT